MKSELRLQNEKIKALGKELKRVRSQKRCLEASIKLEVRGWNAPCNRNEAPVYPSKKIACAIRPLGEMQWFLFLGNDLDSIKSFSKTYVLEKYGYETEDEVDACKYCEIREVDQSRIGEIITVRSRGDGKIIPKVVLEYQIIAPQYYPTYLDENQVSIGDAQWGGYYIAPLTKNRNPDMSRISLIDAPSLGLLELK